MLVRPLRDDDWSWKNESLLRLWGSASVARRGELVEAALLPGFVAVADEQRLGLLSYDRLGDEMEIVTLHAERQGGGVGRALMDAAFAHAQETEVRRLWLVTTNDNVRAIGFYQRWGMDLVEFIHDGVAVSRRVKPEIPILGLDDIALRHELVFELRLD
ncbi:MAG TPA: GNAT family N-acetyltransferase [Acidimicrobiales bacterium]|jgi:ribosomal protein S18 acetylase RimI-like enzyme